MTESKGKPDTVQLLFSDKQIARIEAVRMLYWVLSSRTALILILSEA